MDKHIRWVACEFFYAGINLSSQLAIQDFCDDSTLCVQMVSSPLYWNEFSFRESVSSKDTEIGHVTEAWLDSELAHTTNFHETNQRPEYTREIRATRRERRKESENTLRGHCYLYAESRSRVFVSSNLKTTKKLRSFFHG